MTTTTLLERPPAPPAAFDQRPAALDLDGVVEYLSDGDTVAVRSGGQRVKIRMLGIDTPELHFHGERQSPWAEAAHEYLSGLIPPGTSVRLVTDQEEFDQYGRMLAYVMSGQRNINLEMVRSGWAAPYQIYPNLRLLGPMQEACAAAEAQGLGIFDPHNPLPLLPYEFRQQVEHRPPSKFCGDTQTRMYVAPREYQRVPVSRRVFFFSEADAAAFGYSPAASPHEARGRSASPASRPAGLAAGLLPRSGFRPADGFFASRVTEPRIFSTSEWGARPPRAPISVLPNRPDRIVIHHTTHDNTTDFSQRRAFTIARGIQDFHMDDPRRRWLDTGQHFTVSRGGFILEGHHRSLDVARGGRGHVLGAHAGPECNRRSVGIESEGTYGSVLPPAPQRSALTELCAWLCRQYGINPANIRGHRECSATECPGNTLFIFLPSLRRDVSALLSDTT